MEKSEAEELIKRLIKDKKFIAKLAEDSFDAIDACDKYETFMLAMMDKFFKRALEHDRSLKPWKDFSGGEIRERLEDEYKEYMKSCRFSTSFVYDDDELLDIANFAMFLWTMAQIDKEEDVGSS